MLSLRSLKPHLLLNSSKRLVSSDPKKPFDKILIANRGEIACRVMKTCKKLGVKTVAVYSEADASAMHVRMADEAYCIGLPLSKDSYLKMERILHIAKKTGAQAIHPGYGFLSENAKFVDMCEHAGIAFIGPSSGPMNEMGDKLNSKKIAKAANCFVIPGYAGEVIDGDHAAKLAEEVGYPVMIKASAGGGGKGMRVAYNEEQVREGFRLSKSEAMSSFGDDRMLIERFIEDPHHIEIQVLADTHGNVVAFPERECSVQRRNQKVVEESPSCLLLPETRRKMQEQAIALCKAVGYRSAGTIESLADGKQNFYFLEMNTRLQVEHPITELVSGEDLVEHMLWIAAGKPLPPRLTSNPHLNPKGWAIESRVYAEDPLRNFLPSIGPLITYKEPTVFHSENGTVRNDTGVFEGGVISMYYDPMIAKLCTHGKTREQARILMEDALDNYVVNGLGNNLPFLRSVLRNPSFITGKYGTKFIPEQYPKGFKGVTLTERETKDLIASAVALSHVAATHARGGDFDPTADFEDLVVLIGGSRGKPYRVSSSMGDALVMDITPMAHNGQPEGETKTIAVRNADWRVGNPLSYIMFNGDEETADEVSREKILRPESQAEEDGDDLSNTYTRVVQYEGPNANSEGVILRLCGSQQDVVVRSLRQHELSQYMKPPPVRDMAKYLLCPMPGTVVSVSVKPGQKVEQGQELAVVEAMKMQNVLRAERHAIVKNVLVKPGNHLKVDQIIVEFEADATATA